MILVRDPNRLYRLLPAMYREQDARAGYPLRGLLQLVNDQADEVRDNVRQLWDDFFIETASRWVIPYVGDLVGNNQIHDVDLAAAAVTAESLFLADVRGPNLRPPSAIRTRADVAKTIYYRRRKGTPAMLEELARDVTGWGAHVVEFFEHLTWNQNVNHLRRHSTGSVLLRSLDECRRVQTAWDTASHTIDVRRIDQREGWFNISNIGFFLWRLRSYPLRLATPFRLHNTRRRYTFSPLGNSAPLFMAPAREDDETGLATERNVADGIHRVAFHDDLRAHQAVPPSPTPALYGDPARSEASVGVFEDGTLVPIAKVACANLRNWPAADPNDDLVYIDVTRGRLLVGQQRDATKTLRVSCSYGFPADMGGGPYDRRRWESRAREGRPLRTLVVGTPAVPTLNAALAQWGAFPDTAADDTRIILNDNGVHAWSNPVSLKHQAQLIIEALGSTRPVIAPVGGLIQIVPAVAGERDASSLTINGVVITGTIQIEQDVQRLRLWHCTFVPGRTIADNAAPPSASVMPSLIAQESDAAGRINAGLRVEIAYSILGPISMPSHGEGLWLLDSIVDAPKRAGFPDVNAIGNVAGTSGPPARIERSSILGTSRFARLPLASESIFTERVLVDRRQDGCVRFSYVTRDSRTPRQFRCQPGEEIERTQREADARGVILPATFADAIALALQPAFASTRYGDPAYGQLRLTCPRPITQGAEDGSEMGAFNHLKQAQRESNLRVRLDEYLPVGLTAGIIYVN